MGRQWVLLMMGNAQLRRLYVRLLRRRGHHVHTTRDFEEATRLIQSNEFDLAIIDEDLSPNHDTGFGPELASLNSAIPIVLLRTPKSSDAAEEAVLRPDPVAGVELILQKPISPMEFGIQIDHLLDTSAESVSTLEEDSVAEREYDALREEFVLRLDEDLAQLAHLWAQLCDDLASSQRYAVRLRRAIHPVRAAARQFGFIDLADTLAELTARLEPWLTPGAAVHEEALERGEALVNSLHEICQMLQSNYPSSAPATDTNATTQTILVIDPDRDYLRQAEEYCEQFMLRIRSAQSIDEAIHRVRTPLLTGVLLSLSSAANATALNTAINRLRAASPLSPLPIALVGESGEDLDAVQTLWSGASALISKPLSASSFARAVHRLSAVRRAQKASILVIDPDADFAEFVSTHLESRHTAVHYHATPRSLFESLEEHRPDLLILGAHVPSVSSFDVCRALRSIPRWRAIPIILVANEDDQPTRVAAYEAGVDDFFCRTIDADELRARVSVRLERIRLLRERADRDALTGLLTRRAFLEQLAARLSEATRHKRRLAFAILDVDHFKEVNDRHGHPAGDRVLARLGKQLRECFRIEDLRCRWGGEEFAIVLIDEDIESAHQALDRVLEEFSSTPFVGTDDQPFHVTFSAGIAGFPGDGHDAETLLGTADARLLRAKKGGRNQVLIGQA